MVDVCVADPEDELLSVTDDVGEDEDPESVLIAVELVESVPRSEVVVGITDGSDDVVGSTSASFACVVSEAVAVELSVDPVESVEVADVVTASVESDVIGVVDAVEEEAELLAAVELVIEAPASVVSVPDVAGALELLDETSSALASVDVPFDASPLIGAKAATSDPSSTASTAGTAGVKTRVTLLGSAELGGAAGAAGSVAFPAGVASIKGPTPSSLIGFVTLKLAWTAGAVEFDVPEGSDASLLPQLEEVPFVVVVELSETVFESPAMTVQMGRTIPVLGLYAKDWLLCMLEELAAAVMLPTHGSMVSGAGAGGFGSKVAQ